MTLLALVLVGEEASGSLAVGAQLAGIATLTAGIAAPLRGRQLDRGGLREGLRQAALLTAAVLVAQAVAVIAGAPLPVLYVLAALHGASFSALSGGFRALLVPVVSAEDLPRANTLEAVFIEVAFVAGPSLAGILALFIGPVGVLLAMAAASVGSAVLTGTLPPVPADTDRSSAPPWRARGAKPVYLLALMMGITLGLMESALPPRAEDLGLAAAAAGPLLALVAGGSAVGGLAAALRHDHRRHQARLAVALFVGLGLALAGLAAATSLLPLGVMLFVLGVPIAPLNALGALRLQDVVPNNRLGEGFAIYTAMILAGAGIGQSLTGQLLDIVGAQALLGGAAVVPALAGLAMAATVARTNSTRRSQAQTAG